MLIYQRFIITINQFWGQELAHSVSSIEVSAKCFKDQDGLAQIGGFCRFTKCGKDLWTVYNNPFPLILNVPPY